MPSRVFFVTHSQRFNVKPAERFGQVVFLMGSDVVSPFQTDRIMHTIGTRMLEEGFDPSSDFVALTGGHIFVALFLSFAVAKYGEVKALLFDARYTRYQERIISLTQDVTPKEV